jgi:hypothetical protein
MIKIDFFKKNQSDKYLSTKVIHSRPTDYYVENEKKEKRERE